MFQKYRKGFSRKIKVFSKLKSFKEIACLVKKFVPLLALNKVTIKCLYYFEKRRINLLKKSFKSLIHFKILKLIVHKIFKF